MSPSAVVYYACTYVSVSCVFLVCACIHFLCVFVQSNMQCFAPSLSASISSYLWESTCVLMLVHAHSLLSVVRLMFDECTNKYTCSLDVSLGPTSVGKSKVGQVGAATLWSFNAKYLFLSLSVSKICVIIFFTFMVCSPSSLSVCILFCQHLTALTLILNDALEYHSVGIMDLCPFVHAHYLSGQRWNLFRRWCRMKLGNLVQLVKASLCWACRWVQWVSVMVCNYILFQSPQTEFFHINW